MVIKFSSVMEDITMAKPLVSDALWERIEPLFPELPPHPKGGRPWVGNREALTGILFVLRSGIPWEMLPQEMGCGCGMTCWRRLRDWQAAGVWDRLHRVLLDELREADKIDWSRAVVDSASLRALAGGPKTGPNPTDRAKPGSKHHVITDAQGIPLAAILTAANVNDIEELLPLVDSIPPVRGKPGRPRHIPDRVQGDRGYDSEPHRKQLRDRGIEPVLAKRNTEHGSGMGVYRWVVERTLAWLHQFRRLRIRYERRDDIHEAFMSLAESLICLNFINALC
jgi:transposase